MRKVASKTEQNLRLQELEEQAKKDAIKQEQAKKNNNFIQLYRDHMEEFSLLIEKNPLASRILVFIIQEMDSMNCLAISQNFLCEIFERSRPTVWKAVTLLKDSGFIDILKMGTSNVFVVNTNFAWTSYHNQKYGAKFTGKIFVSKSENENFSTSMNKTKSERIKVIEKQKTPKK